MEKIIQNLIDRQIFSKTLTQPRITREEAKNLMEDIVNTSNMHLDETSMEKLWELTTMVLKWEVSMCGSPERLFDLTRRHVAELKKYTSSPSTLDSLAGLLECLNGEMSKISQNSRNDILNELMSWFEPFNVKVSLLIKLGIQTPRGELVTSFDRPGRAMEILNDLGQNIYVTDDKDNLAALIKHRRDAQCNYLRNNLLGENGNGHDNFKLSLLGDEIRRRDFEEIRAERDDTKLERLLKEFHVHDDDEEEDDEEYNFCDMV